MSITPQAIKDQEFEVKFRGYDSIEVKAYLEVLAEEFFELHELRRKQEEEYAELYEENQALREEKEAFLAQDKEREERSEESEKQFQEKDNVIADLQGKIEELEKKIEGSEQEKILQLESWEKQENELRGEIDNLNERVAEKEEALFSSLKEVEDLQGNVETLEKKLSEVKDEEVDLKTTLLAAQKFSEDLKEKAKIEAERIIEQAREETERIRREMEAELASLPGQIDELEQKKAQVREDLRTILLSYLTKLDVVDGGSVLEGDNDLSDLFQSISYDDDKEKGEPEFNQAAAE